MWDGMGHGAWGKEEKGGKGGKGRIIADCGLMKGARYKVQGTGQEKKYFSLVP